MRTIKEIFRSYGILNSDGKHINGTDKETNHHYGDAYESLFVVQEDVDLSKIPTQPHIKITGQYRSIRNDVRLMMEVGVADGSSLLAWREIFPNAIIVGMDIHYADKAHGERIEFHFGDQRNKEHCERAAAGREFDLIVDDATHELDATLLTLFWLWPFVKPGGLYVVEDGGLQDCERVVKLFPQATVVETTGPFGGIEPLVVLRKST